MTESHNNKKPEKKLPDEEIQVIEEIVEGYWICPNCSAKNKGSEQQCDSCGAIRGENVEFFCDDDAQAITDEKELEKAKAGPDWICQFCGNTSPAEAKDCTGCGSSRSSGKNRKEKEVPKETPQAQKGGNSGNSAQPPKPMPIGCTIGIGLAALIFIILMALSCQQKPGKIEITSNAWKRVIEREEFKTVRESAWKNEVPNGAIKISSNREVKSYNQIPDGFEEVDEEYTEKVKTGEKKVEDGKVDLGNGRFKIKYKMVPEYRSETKTRRVKRQKYRKEPVYDEKVTYDINKWLAINQVESSGKEDEPIWPETKATNRTPPQVGDIREGKKTEEYSVKALKIGETKDFDIKTLQNKPLTFEQFMKLRKGTQWDAVFSGLGALVEIKFEPVKK